MSKKIIKVSDNDSFMDSRDGGINFLKDFMIPFVEVPTDLLDINIILLMEPYWDFSCLFTWLMGQESTSHILGSVLYVLHFSFWKESLFHWAKLISNEIFFQLDNYVKTHRFFMAAYLVLAVSYCNVFEGLSLRSNLDVENEPVQF